MINRLSIISMLYLCNTVQGAALADGVTYSRMKLEKIPAIAYVVRVDSSKADICVEAAHGKCNSTETVSDIAQRTQAVVAINGGFFDFGKKNRIEDLLAKVLDCIGINTSKTYPIFGLKIKDKWFSLSHVRAGLVAWQANNKRMHFGTGQMKWKLILDDVNYIIADINKPYASGPILYTSAYDTATPQKPSVTEVVVQNNRVIAIKRSHGNTQIPDDGFVYSIEHTKGKRQPDVSVVCIGSLAIVEKSSDNESVALDEMDYMVGSTPLLIDNNTITETVLTATSEFFVKRHPRTAIGITNDGHWILLVVDGRCAQSKGMTLIELARFMQSLGCTYALNLDGGGSSTLAINGAIVNRVSGREWALVRKERNVSNAILVKPR